MIRRFKIFYIDGSTFVGLPEDAPTHSFVACIASNDHTKGNQSIGRPVIREWDIYIYSDAVGGWHGTNKYADLMNHLKHSGCGLGGVRCVLEGLWIDNETYHAILERAETDPDFNRKSANNPVIEEGRE